MIDEMLFSRVVFNLLHNAIKFSPTDSAISLSVVLYKEYLEVKIKDNGIGFADFQKRQLFTKFSKISRKETSSQDSIGIGLYLCRQIANKFNGYIDAHSEGENCGAVFTVGFRVTE